MSDTFTVIGNFDCGCGQAAQPESMEIVLCSSRKEVDLVAERMRQHAAGDQCFQEPAMAIIVVPGEPEVLHEVKRLPEAYLLFRDAQTYLRRHDERKKDDARWGRVTLARAMERLKQEHASE